MSKVFDIPFADVYPHYVNKVLRKGNTVENLHTVITWLTDFDETAIKKHLENKTTFRDFFDQATINPNAILITGKICGVTIQEIEDPLMQKIRYLDKLVDEVGQGRAMTKILRTPATK